MNCFRSLEINEFESTQAQRRMQNDMKPDMKPVGSSLFVIDIAIMMKNNWINSSEAGDRTCIFKPDGFLTNSVLIN